MDIVFLFIAGFVPGFPVLLDDGLKRLVIKD